jgi:hypothetical protein
MASHSIGSHEGNREGSMPLQRVRFDGRRRGPAARLSFGHPRIDAMPKAPIVSAVVAAAVTAAAFLLNPSPEQHRARIKEAIAERSPLAGALGMGALTAFASTYHSLGVASYTTVNERIASVGALGMVFVPPPSTDK